MTRKAIYYMAALLAALAAFAACQQDEGLEAQPDSDGEYVTLEFQADIPELDTQEFGTRAVDPDGGGVRSMTLFCFDNFGLFITTATATLPTGTVFSGTLTASVPRYTRRIHFVANQNMTDFHESMFINKSESEVMALLEGSAGQMIYWARFACAFITPQEGEGQPTIANELNGKTITMLRNHARISVVNPKAADNEHIEIKGIEAYNIYAFGTVAPYDPDKGFDFTIDEWEAADFVTIPQRDAKQSDIRSVTFTTHQYIFEHDNRSDDPISIILRGRPVGATEDLYYRVLLIDKNGDFIPVRRNHDYKLNIEGELSFGKPTFEEALTAAATNNVWIAISDRVNEVEDTSRILRVNETHVVRDEVYINEFKSIVLTCSVKKKEGAADITAADQPTLSWLDNTVAAQDVRFDEFKINDDKTEGTGTIVISPRALGDNDRLEGTILVKLGHLQRKIKIVLIKVQSFAPSWISSGIFGHTSETETDSKTGVGKFAHVTMLFTIPENCPSELFPMKVCITAPELDIRSESGMMLPVVREGDADWYQSKDGPADASYKFVLTVDKPGPQRIYFENILAQEEGYRGTVVIESPHFATMTRTYTFSEAAHAITVANLERFTATDIVEGSKDEYVYFYRVAQKTGAYVKLDMELHEKATDDKDAALGAPVNATEKDEFLFYSRNLNNYRYGEYNPEGVAIDCRFAPYTDKAEAWQQLINKNGGRMLMFKPVVTDADPPLGTGKYTLHLYTNRARSAEVVRISSNLNNQPAVSTSDPDDTVADTPENIAAGTNNLYGGTVYRSFVLELTNYTPFRFGARVRYDGGEWQGEDDEPDRTTDLNADKPEAVTPLVWSYKPEKEVEIAIDVTSFKGPDGKSVDPFGRQFEIYIDAPMLDLDKNRLAEYNLDETKIKADPNVPGRFIYTVDADRAAERAFGTEAAKNVDGAAAAGDQQGERKILPFKVKSIASAGDIVISSNEEQVVFYAKTFRVTNESIKGNIRVEMQQADGTMENETVKQNEFVAFERVSNGNRIGAVTITADGKFELRLRKEYPLNWYGYEVAFHYEHQTADGKHHLHHATYPSLAEMYEALQRGETVILKGEE